MPCSQDPIQRHLPSYSSSPTGARCHPTSSSTTRGSRSTSSTSRPAVGPHRRSDRRPSLACPLLARFPRLLLCQPRTDSGFQESQWQRQQRRRSRFGLIPQLRKQARRPLFGRCWHGSGEGLQRGSVVWHAPTAARTWQNRRAGQLGGLARAAGDAGEREGTSRGRSDGAPGRGARAAWRWRGSARASLEPPEPCALGRTCALKAAAAAAPTICCARYGMRDR